MPDSDRPRLIEVAFPLKQASLDSVHEKNVRHGHISTLHIWPARRPLAACRAALIATLLPDPGTPEKRQELLEKIGGKVVTEVQKKKVGGKTIEVVKERTEGGVLHWGNENSPDMDWFREEIKKAYGGRAPKVLDPFAGGGAIPLEAMRLGCEATAIDINPVAWFILKCTLEYPQKLAGQVQPLPKFALESSEFIEAFFKGSGKLSKAQAAKKLPKYQRGLFLPPDADLSWHVRAWGWWVLQRARKDLERLYPTIEGNPTVAYLHNQLRDFWDVGTRGPDFVWAATGPAMEAYSKHPVVKKANEPGKLMEVSEFLRAVRRLVVDFVVGRVLTGGDETSASGLDDVTTYYILHRHDFGVSDAPVGPCILYAVSCNLSDRDLADRFDILLRTGGLSSADDDEVDVGDEETDADAEPEEGTGSIVKLRPWHQRKRKTMGYDAEGHPAPLIDQVHRLMHFWKTGDVAKVDDYLDARGLRKNALFLHLLQALIELSRRDEQRDELVILENLSNHLQARGVAPTRSVTLPGFGDGDQNETGSEGSGH